MRQTASMRALVSPLLLAGLALQPALAARRPAGEDGLLRVGVAVDVAAESTRVVLTHARRVGYVLDAPRGKVHVRYDEPVRVDPPRGRPGASVLAAWSQDGERGLVFETGPAFAGHDAFVLDNPFRIVLDLRAQAAGAAGGKGALRKPRERGDAGRARASRLPGRILVVDPGHGGVEHGAAGATGLLEKDVTLALARRLKRLIEESDATVEVVLTRDEDVLVGLDERAAVANHNRADLFLSLHVNSSPRAQARGSETYYLDTRATDEEARILARLENSTAPADGDPVLPPPGSLDLVLWDLAQNQHLAESSQLAESVQRQLDTLAGTPDRGVRQAPFRVLMGATMPAILVEVGFISNPEEERLLGTAEHQERLAAALAAAVRDYLARLDHVAPREREPRDGR